ncbi:MAG TPA: 2-C-methyl-D-erythritol 4-phosphate cytidylyltransferase [Candidatus Saccharimonadaceae bacterium]|nr:2-C-methyl-D-erythritol 4-phosphate cytidylyltransferase [Candidatus Saccharimonadaceae bacterium]
MSVGALLLCAGQGERLGLGMPKAAATLAGRPLFTWSLDALDRCPAVHAIVMVGPVRTLKDLAAASAAPTAKVAGWVEGGRERQHSVAKGLAALPADCTLVAVHDSARALVSPDCVARVIGAALEHGAALAAMPLEDTLKRATLDTVDATVTRAGLWRAQTPQVFRRDWLEAAHAAAQATATDDAALVEALGHRVHLVQGESTNFKITTADDLSLAEAWLAGAHGEDARWR